MLIALANYWIKLARFSLHSSCYMLGTLTNVQYFFRVSCQCDIQLRILPGWYRYIWYTLSSLALYARWEGIYICTLCIVYICLNNEVILDVIFQLIKIFLQLEWQLWMVFSSWPNLKIWLTEVVMCFQG